MIFKTTIETENYNPILIKLGKTIRSLEVNYNNKPVLCSNFILDWEFLFIKWRKKKKFIKNITWNIKRFKFKKWNFYTFR